MVEKRNLGPQSSPQIDAPVHNNCNILHKTNADSRLILHQSTILNDR